MRLKSSFILACFCLIPAQSPACMGLTRANVPVRFTHQVNLIVWDPKAQVEHFIRNASFKTDAADLAFIAPTPTVPDMKEVDPNLFTVLERERSEAENPPKPAEPGPPRAAGMTMANIPPPVQVIKEADVAGYHAAVLKADDSQALAQWLTDNNYPLTDEVKAWCEPYIAKGWYLTAFKVATDGTAGSTGLVRLTFSTSTPFNPYYVPASNQPKDGEREGLDLYFLSTGLYDGAIGGTQPWIGSRIDFNTLASDFEDMLGLQPGTLPGNLVASYYKDPSFPRVNTDDVYFTPSGRDMVKPAPPVEDSPVSAVEFALNRGQPPATALKKAVDTAVKNSTDASPTFKIVGGVLLVMVGMGAWSLGKRSGRRLRDK